jgi:hypothetical protein
MLLSSQNSRVNKNKNKLRESSSLESLTLNRARNPMKAHGVTESSQDNPMMVIVSTADNLKQHTGGAKELKGDDEAVVRIH